MVVDTGLLFESLEVQNHTLRNRIVMPPMVTNRDILGEDGIAWYGERARGGVGLVIVEATSVFRFDGSDLTGERLEPLADAIHAGGALAAIQLFPARIGQAVAPADLSGKDIDVMVARYTDAAEVCLAAGFDGIEPHGAHGYLLNQFFAPERNARTDDYGGSAENRGRLALRIVDAVRPVCDRGMLLLWRHTPEGPGYAIADSLPYVLSLVKHGVDILDLSPSSIDAPGSHAAPFCELGVPVITVGALDDGDRALEALHAGRANLVAIGRGLIADPDWPAKVRAGRTNDVTRCVRCDDLCFGNLRRGLPIACTQWN